MKKRIILFAFLLLISKIEVNAQTNEPTIETVTNTCVDPTDYNFNDNTDDQKLEVPFLGWMWNSRAVISAMVLANQEHIFSTDSFSRNNHKSFVNAPIPKTPKKRGSSPLCIVFFNQIVCSDFVFCHYQFFFELSVVHQVRYPAQQFQMQTDIIFPTQN